MENNVITYSKITCESPSSEYVITAVVKKSDIESRKRKALKAMSYYVDITPEVFVINIKVEDTDECPTAGVDLLITPKTLVEKRKRDLEEARLAAIDIIDIGDDIKIDLDHVAK